VGTDVLYANMNGGMLLRSNKTFATRQVLPHGTKICSIVASPNPFADGECMSPSSTRGLVRVAASLDTLGTVVFYRVTRDGALSPSPPESPIPPASSGAEPESSPYSVSMVTGRDSARTDSDTSAFSAAVGMKRHGGRLVTLGD
jgi:hypothetical protein